MALWPGQWVEADFAMPGLRNVYCYRCGKIEVGAEGQCLTDCTFHHGGSRWIRGLDLILEGIEVLLGGSGG